MVRLMQIAVDLYESLWSESFWLLVIIVQLLHLQNVKNWSIFFLKLYVSRAIKSHIVFLA